MISYDWMSVTIRLHQQTFQEPVQVEIAAE